MILKILEKGTLYGIRCGFRRFNNAAVAAHYLTKFGMPRSTLIVIVVAGNRIIFIGGTMRGQQ